MVNLQEIRKEREKDIADSLKIIDIYTEWILRTPNKIWSKKQARLFKSVYSGINRNWRKDQNTQKA